ncbi:cysteine desulfurase CsdA [Candidatus Gracilibacteria bacterium CG17_big_fil_post_rev_8_21_14_2_50_48_13]|nr:MAG: cysteine desulfurase CsdA [Candidatus Gracilibacteria bacterium CG17_big_fil_post_rev_8_21_14_2_50_48_13]
MTTSPYRKYFPFFNTQQDGLPIVYLDSAASAQKLGTVIEREMAFYTHEYSNIHRGVYRLSEAATAAYEHVRDQAAAYMHANSEEIIFTRSATEALNLLAYTIPLREGDVVLVSGMEHHANLVPWFMACQRTGAELREIPVLDDGTIDQTAYEQLLSPRVRVVALTHVSNVLGTINPIAAMTTAAHRVGALMIVDGSQAAPHMPLAMQTLGVDAYVWTGHKFFAPTGTGVLYMNEDLLATLPPWQGGGDMIERVSFDHITYRSGPARFEAGTPNIAGVLGLGSSLTFFSELSWEVASAYEASLAKHALSALKVVPGLQLLGTAEQRVPVFSFTLKGVHPHDVGTILDSDNICVRTGQHCAEPLMQRFGIPATTRISCSLYTTTEEIDAAVASLHKTVDLFA